MMRQLNSAAQPSAIRVSSGGSVRNAAGFLGAVQSATTDVEIDGSTGDLLIVDIVPNGRADGITLSYDGSNNALLITDPGAIFNAKVGTKAGASVLVPVASVTGAFIQVNANARDDEVTADFSAGLLGFPVMLNGGDDLDSLVVVTTTNEDLIVVNAGSVTGMFDDVFHTNVEAVLAYALAGNDRLVSSGGAKTLIGGDGNDTYVFLEDWGNDVVLESAAGGDDVMDFGAVASPLTVNIGTIDVTEGMNSVTHSADEIEELIAGTAGDEVNVNGRASAFEISTGNGSDTINVGTNSLDGILASIDLDAGSGFDRLNILDGDDTDMDSYVVSATSIVRNATAIDFRDVEFFEAFLNNDSVEGEIGDGSGGLLSYRINLNGILDLSGDLVILSDGRLDLGTNGVITGSGNLDNAGIMFAQTNLSIQSGLAMTGGASILGLSNPQLSLGGDYTHASGNATYELRQGGVLFTGGGSHSLTANSSNLGPVLPALVDGNRVIGTLTLNDSVEINGTVYAVAIEGSGNITVNDGARMYYLFDSGWSGSGSILGNGVLEQIRPEFESISESGGVVTGTFPAAPDLQFTVSGTDNLATGSYQVVTGFVATATTESFDDDASGDTNRYYRLSVSP
jgi:hypothetical protein